MPTEELPKSVVYILEIFEPNSIDTVLITFETNSPFMAINRGDIINPNIWPTAKTLEFILQVTNLQHIIWDSPMDNCVKHKLCVYTKQVPNTRSLRVDG
jgi:hypothetical protein